MSTHRKISRRTWLKGMAVFSAAAGMPLMLASTAAEAKASKAAVHYRDYPSGMRMCHMCKFFVSAGGGRSGVMGCPMMGGNQRRRVSRSLHRCEPSLGYDLLEHQNPVICAGSPPGGCVFSNPLRK